LAVLAIADVITDLIATIKYRDLDENNYFWLSLVVFVVSQAFNIMESIIMYGEKKEQMKQF
jgi:hypothetical protein